MSDDLRAPEVAAPTVLADGEDFEARLVDTGRGPHLFVAGEIDLDTGPALSDAMEAALAVDGDLVIDVSGVRFMDSTGLAVLGRAYNHVLVREGSLVVEGASRTVAHLLDVAGLADVLREGPTAS